MIFHLRNRPTNYLNGYFLGINSVTLHQHDQQGTQPFLSSDGNSSTNMELQFYWELYIPNLMEGNMVTD